MLARDLPEEMRLTAKNFGWQWENFTKIHPEFRSEMLEWISPLAEDSFAGKDVLDAGCGKGRHLLLAADFGARHLVGLDLSSAVDVAKALTSSLENVDVVQGDLLSPPLSEASFDVIYSIGVIHHLPDPKRAIATLLPCLRPGGTLHVWVYAHEGNALIRNVVDPVRFRVSRNLPMRVMKLGCLVPTAITYLASRLARRAPALPMPYRAYLRRLSDYSLQHIWTIVYDQLMAPTTHYVKRGEIESWFKSAGLVNVRVRNSRGMSWAATGQRP